MESLAKAFFNQDTAEVEQHCTTGVRLHGVVIVQKRKNLNPNMLFPCASNRGKGIPLQSYLAMVAWVKNTGTKLWSNKRSGRFFALIVKA
jgi:hypothetical protein